MRTFVFLLITALTQAAPTPEEPCGEFMDQVNTCMEQLAISKDAEQFNKRREEIFRTCVPNQTPECSGQKSAVEICQQQSRLDPSILAIRHQMKTNISDCYRRFPVSRSPSETLGLPTGGAPSRGGPGSPFGRGFFGGPPPPPPSAAFSLDPCSPSDSQILCLKHSMDTDVTVRDFGRKLHDAERLCFNSTNFVACRPDNAQLKTCMDAATQPLMQLVTATITQCVQFAGYQMPVLPPPPGPFN